MSDEKTQIEKEIKELEEKIGFINQGIEDVKIQIEAERCGSMIDQSSLENDLKESDSQIERIQSKIDNTKAETKGFKDKINNKKSMYEKLDDNLKTDNWSILTMEVSGDHHQIVKNESKIGSLEMENFAEFQKREMTEHRLNSFKEGLHKLPVEEDPRLKYALEEKKELEGKLAQLKEKLN